MHKRPVVLSCKSLDGSVMTLWPRRHNSGLGSGTCSRQLLNIDMTLTRLMTSLRVLSLRQAAAAVWRHRLMILISLMLQITHLPHQHVYAFTHC